MKLYIDTSNSNKTIIGLDKKHWKFASKNYQSQQLLGLINQITKNGGLINQIDEIKINLGPGSFTGLKVGVSIANTLGWILDIPINGKRQLMVPKYE